MNIGKSVKQFIAKKVFDPEMIRSLGDAVGWHSMSGGMTYSYYKENQYENGYSSITKLVNGFASIEPTTIDKTGKEVASNVLDRIYTPNTDMSAYDFREALMVTTLIHNKVLLRVHYRGNYNGKFIPVDRVTGFTFLEGYNEQIVGGERRYHMPNGEIYTDADIITLKNVNPYQVTAGFSPANGAKRWTRLDDYIADYQKGFFENGAVPAGEMVITASTVTEYNDIVDMMQAKHKGAKKNNNITYSHRPTDPNGKPLNSQIEWVPFSGTNKDMSLGELFKQVNQKIDSAYGVPASIRAVNDANTYASVRVDELIFVKYALDPLTMKIWNKFNHEMNRITGGMGVAVAYKLEVPKLADEEKVKAEARGIDAQTVATLVEQGYTLDTAIEYVKNGNLAVLKLGVPKEEKPEVIGQNDAKDTPSQPIDVYTKGFQAGVAEMKLLNKPKAKKKVAVKQLSPADRANYEHNLASVIKGRMRSQIQGVMNNLDTVTKDVTEKKPIEKIENELLTTEMLSVLYLLVDRQGNIENALNYKLVLDAGIETTNVLPFRLTSAQKKQYSKYIEKVATGYNEQTADKIRNILSTARETDLPVAQIKSQLADLIEEDYRINRLAVSEVNRAGNESSLFSMKNIANQTGATVEKVWEHDGSDSPCEFCRALIGTTVPLDDNFVDLNATIEGADGGLYLNDFVPIQVAEVHPNGHCRQVYKIKGA